MRPVLFLENYIFISVLLLRVCNFQYSKGKKNENTDRSTYGVLRIYCA